MKPAKPEGNSAWLSRRDFLVASAATLAAAAVDPHLLAADSTTATKAGNVSEAAFDQARRRAEALVNRMSLEEVVGQVVNGAPALPKLDLARYNYWSESLHGVNVDGPITSFPPPIAMGCSWNPDLVYRVYTAVSDEARAFHNKTGYGLTFFSPATVNMGLRDPRWGRVNENFSEDPFLVQTLAVQTIRGMQGDNPKYLKTVACAKHYACNDTDDDRDYADAAPDRRSFWEYYTRGFEAAVKQAGVFSVMAAYNSLWGIPCPANSMLLTEILRERWGFKGYVVSDCDAIANIYRTHHYADTAPEAAALAIKAGSDLNCGNTFSQFLMQSYQSKLVSEPAIRMALTRVLTGRFLLGEFDPPASVPWTSLSPEILESREHRELAREASRQSLVLLKNEGHMLPLDKSKLKKVAVIGPMAGSCHLGGYSGRATYLVSPYLGIASVFGASPFADSVPAGEYLSTSDFHGPVVGFADDGSQFLTSIRGRSWAQYGPLDFTGKTSIEFNYASTADGTIAINLDAVSGPATLSVDIPSTGGLDTWKTVSAQLNGITGSHIVFLKFTTNAAPRNNGGGGAANRGSFLNLRSFRLSPASPAPQPTAQVVYAPGCGITDPKNDALFHQAVEAATGADVALVFVGDNRLLSDEGRDRDSFDLPGAQGDLVKAVMVANPHTVVIVNSNCPVGVNWENENAPAILCSLFSGEQQGNAIADALFGNYNPGGKLCSTWYRDVRDLPNFHDYDIKHGRTYMYLRRQPLYPFGHGLSYTTFSYQNLQVSGGQLQAGGTVTVSLEVSNTGSVAGDEIVQFYVSLTGGRPPAMTRNAAAQAGASGVVQLPIKQLAAFRRVALSPGEKQTVSFPLPHDHIALQYWDEQKKDFTYKPGDVDLLVGASSADIRLQGKVTLA